MRRSVVALLIVVLGLVMAACSDDGDGDDNGADNGAGETTSAGPDANAILIAAGEQAEAQAISAVTQMTTYNYRTLAKDFEWVDKLGTEDFQKNYQGASKQVRQVIKQLQATATGTVVDSAPKVLSPTEVRVLLFVDQRIRAKGEDGVRLDQPRVAMTMVQQDGKWLVDSVVIDELVAQ